MEKPERHLKRWTDEEKELLQELVGQHSLTYIAKRMKRTEEGIQRQIDKMGIGTIRELNGYLTAHSLAKLLKVDSKVVLRYIQKYGLPATRKNFKEAKEKKRRFYNILPKDFWEWAESHTDLVNFTQMEKNSLPPEPEWVDKVREEQKKYPKVKPINQGKPWTKKDEKIAYQMYLDKVLYSKMAEYFGRTESSVSKKVTALHKQEIERLKALSQSIEANMDKYHTDWTTEEEKEVIAMREKRIPYKDIADISGRTYYSVFTKVWEIKGREKESSKAM